MGQTIKTKGIYILLVVLISAISSCTNTEPVKRIIFDTDFGGDADDLGALAMLNHFSNKGEIEIEGIMCWNLEEYAVSAIDAVNTYYGNPNIPIARRPGSIHITPWNHSKAIADVLDHDATHANVPDATHLYRELLSNNDDKSMVIVTVGPLMNIKNLIDSKPDKFSSLNGLELINAKVSEFVIMGGNFPSSENEWNFDGNMAGITKYVLENIEVPITFLGAELGSQIRTGEVFNQLESKSPLYLGFYHFSKHAPWMKHQFEGKIYDNATFDQTAVLYAVRNGVGDYWQRIDGGICVADSIGGNVWRSGERSNHSYLVLKKPITLIESEIEAFMLGDF